MPSNGIRHPAHKQQRLQGPAQAHDAASARWNPPQFVTTCYVGLENALVINGRCHGHGGHSLVVTDTLMPDHDGFADYAQDPGGSVRKPLEDGFVKIALL